MVVRALESRDIPNDKARAFDRVGQPAVVRGRYTPQQEGRLCIVICDEWPSWVFVCEANGLICYQVYVCARNAPWVTALRGLYPDVNWVYTEEDDLQGLVSGTHCSTVVLVQGSPDLCLNIPEEWCSMRPLCICSSLNKFQHPNAQMSSVKLEHHLCGGVTTGSWRVHYNPAFFTVTQPEPTATSRRIRHIIHQANPGKHIAVAEPADAHDRTRAWFLDAGRRILHWGGLLPYDRPWVSVRCRSVFSKTGWVDRPLTAAELAQSHDVPVAVSKEYSGYAARRCKSLPFLGMPPSKVLDRWWKVVELMPLKPSIGEARRTVSGLDHQPPATQQPERPLEELPSVKEAAEGEGRFDIATKPDDAEIPVFVWDNKVWGLGLHCQVRREAFTRSFGRCPLVCWRFHLVGAWRRRVTRSFTSYMQREYGLDWKNDTSRQAEWEAGVDCVRRAVGSDWWEWTQGSRLFFWRWPRFCRRAALEGFPVWVKDELPAYTRPQRSERDPAVRVQVRRKLEAVRAKGYIAPGEVRSLTGYFAVPKGQDDIRMVYDATQSGLNAALWAPNFGLPTVDSLVQSVETTTWMADLDLGEMFLNFMLHPCLRPYCGVDLRPYFGGGAKKTMWESWSRCMMGLMPSPYLCLKGVLLADEIVKGDRCDPSNPFRWSEIHLNLPGDPSYDPTRPRVSKIRGESGRIAGSMSGYVDDLRPTGESEAECWKSTHQAGAKFAYLGVQNASRKTRPPSQ